jgi:hypothetical protein
MKVYWTQMALSIVRYTLISNIRQRRREKKEKKQIMFSEFVRGAQNVIRQERVDR